MGVGEGDGTVTGGAVHESSSAIAIDNHRIA